MRSIPNEGLVWYGSLHYNQRRPIALLHVPTLARSAVENWPTARKRVSAVEPPLVQPALVTGGAGGIGLKQMRERVEARGGRLEVVSGNGNGTTILAAIPA